MPNMELIMEIDKLMYPFLVATLILVIVALVIWVGWGLSPWYTIHDRRHERETWATTADQRWLQGGTLLPWQDEQAIRIGRRLWIVCVCGMGILIILGDIFI